MANRNLLPARRRTKGRDFLMPARIGMLRALNRHAGVSSIVAGMMARN
jgi:hypothetical protein